MTELSGVNIKIDIIGYDLNYDVTIKIEGHSSDNRVIVVLSTEK